MMQKIHLKFVLTNMALRAPKRESQKAMSTQSHCAVLAIFRLQVVL